MTYREDVDALWRTGVRYPKDMTERQVLQTAASYCRCHPAECLELVEAAVERAPELMAAFFDALASGERHQELLASRALARLLPTAVLAHVFADVARECEKRRYLDGALDALTSERCQRAPIA